MAAFDPTAISQLLFWHEPTKGGMTQDYTGTPGAASAGATPVATNGDLVGFLPDQSGNNFHAVSQTTTTTRPTYNSTGLSSTTSALAYNGTSTYLTMGKPVGMDILQNCSYTFIGVYQEITGSGAYANIFGKNAGGDARFFLLSQLQAPLTSRQFGRNSEATPDYGKYSLPLNSTSLVAYRCTLVWDLESQSPPSILAREEIFYNGIKVYDQVNALANAVYNTTNDWTFGASNTAATPNFFLKGSMAFDACYSRALSDAELRQVFTYCTKFGAKCGETLPGFALPIQTTVPSSTTNVVMTGNSLVQGVNGFGRNYPTQLQEMMGSFPMRWANLGIGGQSTTGMIGAFPNREKTLYSPGQNNIYIFWEVTNDIAGGVSVATSYANFVSYSNLCKAIGVKLIVLDMLPRSAVTQTETNRIAVNALIKADFPTAVPSLGANVYTGASYADYFIQVSADANIGAPGSQNNTTYYSTDTIHLTALGYNIVASYIKPVLQYVYRNFTTGILNDMAQMIGATNPIGSVGESLASGRSMSMGKLDLTVDGNLNPTAITQYYPDGTTVLSTQSISTAAGHTIRS